MRNLSPYSYKIISCEKTFFLEEEALFLKFIEGIRFLEYEIISPERKMHYLNNMKNILFLP